MIHDRRVLVQGMSQCSSREMQITVTLLYSVNTLIRANNTLTRTANV